VGLREEVLSPTWEGLGGFFPFLDKWKNSEYCPLNVEKYAISI